MPRRLNPYGIFLGSFIPNWLLQRREISQGAKLCYARLAQFAGKDGLCFPRQETLAQEIGVSVRMCRSYVKELAEAELIETEQPGLQKPLHYYFLSHEWMASGLERQDSSGQDGNNLPDQTGSNLPVNTKKRESVQDNQSKGKKEEAEEPLLVPLSEEEAKSKPLEAARRIVTVWNSTTPERFTKVRDIEGRAKKILPRLKEQFFRENWRAALELACKLPCFAKGTDWNRERKWKPTFDWFCRPDTVAKILEGDYGTLKKPRKRAVVTKTTSHADGAGGQVNRQEEGLEEADPVHVGEAVKDWLKGQGARGRAALEEREKKKEVE